MTPTSKKIYFHKNSKYDSNFSKIAIFPNKKKEVENFIMWIFRFLTTKLETLNSTLETKFSKMVDTFNETIQSSHITSTNQINSLTSMLQTYFPQQSYLLITETHLNDLIVQNQVQWQFQRNLKDSLRRQILQRKQH